MAERPQPTRHKKRQPSPINFCLRLFASATKHGSRNTNHHLLPTALPPPAPHPPPPAQHAPASETAAPSSNYHSKPCSSAVHKTLPTSATHTSASRTSSRTRRAPSTPRSGNNKCCRDAPRAQRHPPTRSRTTTRSPPRTPPRSIPSAALPSQSTVGTRASSCSKSVPLPKKNR